MNLNKIIIILISIIITSSCADYKVKNISQKAEKQYFSSIGFALIFEDHLFNFEVIFSPATISLKQ